ncbi:MAG: arylsulfatase A related enzyme [halophilic archaeon J07HX64]|jgi:Arylsulfatase A and related enzymes|nr:MAG: arylsulfatase A related enzyme [halophilic archaeon J07HX64]
MSRQPNVVWLTLDSVRQDHTTMGGYDRETTPRIQEIADRPDGVAFSSCLAHARASATSVPSLLSGTCPSRHGTYYRESTAFPEELPLAAELFREAGYRTVGVSNNEYAGSLTNTDRGFDQFTLLGSSPTEILRSAGLGNVLKFARNIRRHSVGFSTDTHAHSGAYLLTEIVKRELRRAEEPLFAYVHYNEPHRAYYPPMPYLDRYTEGIPMSGTEAAEIAMDIHHNLVEHIADGCDLTDEEWAALRAMYDAEIAYTDDRVGALYNWLQAELGETVLAITADHGELFGEDDMLAYKYSMHNAVLQVLMVLAGIEGLADEGLVQHADVLRTLLEVAGADTETVQGVDLRGQRREYAISQSPEDSLEPLLEHDPNYDTSQFPAEPYSVIQEKKFKYYQRTYRSRLHRLPNETENIADEFPEKVEQFNRYLNEWLGTEGQQIGHAEAVSVDKATRERRAELAYLDHKIGIQNILDISSKLRWSRY